MKTYYTLEFAPIDDSSWMKEYLLINHGRTDFTFLFETLSEAKVVVEALVEKWVEYEKSGIGNTDTLRYQGHGFEFVDNPRYASPNLMTTGKLELRRERRHPVSTREEITVDGKVYVAKEESGMSWGPWERTCSDVYYFYLRKHVFEIMVDVDRLSKSDRRKVTALYTALKTTT